MKMFKKMALCLIAAAISSYTFADVIELDALSPDHCRQQILNSTDETPVIAAYLSNDQDSDLFMKNFDLLAKEHPERTFFKWDGKKDIFHATQSMCLQQLGIFMKPSIILLAVAKSDTTEFSIMTSPLRLQWSGGMTMIEMNKFIQIDLNMKQSIISQKKGR